MFDEIILKLKEYVSQEKLIPRKILERFPVGAKVVYDYISRGIIKEVYVQGDNVVDLVIEFREESDGIGIISLTPGNNDCVRIIN